MDTLNIFAEKVTNIFLEGNDYDDIDPLYKKYIEALKSPDMTMPMNTSSGADVLTTLMNSFKDLLENGDFKQVCMDNDAATKYAWYPFIIDYTWSGNVVIYAVNLITRWIAKRMIHRETDFTSYHESTPRMLKQLPADAFILPTHDYTPQCDYPLYDADHDIRICVKNKYTLDFDGKHYEYNPDTKVLYLNDTQLHSSDEDDIADFDVIMTGAGHNLQY